MSENEKELNENEIESLRKQWQNAVEEVYKPFLEISNYLIKVVKNQQNSEEVFKNELMKHSKDPIINALATSMLASRNGEVLLLSITNQLVNDVKNLGNLLFLVTLETNITIPENIEKELKLWFEERETMKKTMQQYMR